MSNSLFRKLFLAFSSVILVVVLSLLLYVNWSFKRGFNDYLLAQELGRVEALVGALQLYHREHGGWSGQRSLDELWRDELILRGDKHPPRPPKKNAHKKPDHKKPGPKGGRLLEHRLVLLDAQGQYLAGSPQLLQLGGRDRALLLRTAIHVGSQAGVEAGAESAEQLVGELLFMPPALLDNQLASAFQDRQLSQLMWVAPVALLLALLASALLVRHFLWPIKRLATGTRCLNSGDYSHRIAHVGQDELGRLAQDFNGLAETLEREERLRRSWIADISHELRTPLAVLRSEIEAIQDGIRKPEPHRITALHAQVMSLSKLVDDLHQLSLGDAGLIQLSLQTLDLCDLLRGAQLANEARAQSLGLSLQLELKTTRLIVNGEQSRLLQLFNNLLDNSLRHTASGGRVLIEAAEQGDRAVVRLYDSAPGVADEALSKLFERLYRADESRNRNSGGSGLGLSIARQISQSHGASLTAQHSPLGGLLIEFNMPLLAHK